MITLPQLPEIHIGALSNGMKYVFIPDKGSGLIHVEVRGYAGSLLETDPRIYGVAHFLEHMVCKGTKSFPNEDAITDEFDLIGAYRNGWTSQVSKRYAIGTDTSKSVEAIRFVSECILDPILDESIIERERSVIQSELRDAFSEGDMQIKIKLAQMLYDSPRFAVHSILGGDNSIKNITKKDLVDFRDKFYTPANFIIGSVGDITHEEFITIAEREIGAAPYGSGVDRIVIRRTDLKSIVSDSPLVKNSKIKIAWTLRQENCVRDYHKLLIPILIIGQMRRSRLSRILREKEALVYGARMSMPDLSSAAPECSITTSVNKESVNQAVELSMQCVHSFLKDGPTDKEIEQAINKNLFDFKNNIINKRSVLNVVIGDMLFNPEFVSVEDELHKITSFNKNESMAALHSLVEKEPVLIITNPS